MAYPDIKNKDKDKYIESDIVKHFTIPDKLRNSDHDIKCITLKVIDSQKVTWTMFAILAMFFPKK